MSRDATLTLNTRYIILSINFHTFKTLHLILLINYMVLNNFFPYFQNKLHLLFIKIFFSNHEVALYVLQIIEKIMYEIDYWSIAPCRAVENGGMVRSCHSNIWSNVVTNSSKLAVHNNILFFDTTLWKVNQGLSCRSMPLYTAMWSLSNDKVSPHLTLQLKSPPLILSP